MHTLNLIYDIYFSIIIIEKFPNFFQVKNLIKFICEILDCFFYNISLIYFFKICFV